MKINKNLIKYFLFVLVSIVTLVACVEDTDFSTPEVGVATEPNIQTTKTISELIASYNDQPMQFSENEIIAGYVASSDQAGNIYKSLVIQDKPENPTSGIAIAIDATGTYTTYQVGRKVYVNLKGLYLSKSNGLLTIGAGVDDNFVSRISEAEVRKHVVRSTEVATMVAKPVLISNIKESDLNQLIVIEKAQFVDEELGMFYANANNNDSENRTIIGCADSGKLILRNSGFASFKGIKLPEGSGAITGVLGRYNDDVQMYIRTTEDVNFTDARCTPVFSSVNIETNTTIKLIKEMYVDRIVEFNADEELVFAGYITSDDTTGNIYKTLYIQDSPENPEHGIQISVDNSSMSENYQVGRKVYVKLNGLFMDMDNGVLKIGAVEGISLDRIPAEEISSHLIAGERFNIVPKPTTIDEILGNDNFVSTLVELNNIQLLKSELGSAYANPENTFSVNRTLFSCDSESTILIRNSGFASFKNQEFPRGSGKIIALVSKYRDDYQVFIRDTNDIDFTGERCDPPLLECGSATSEGSTVLFEEDFTNFNGFDSEGWKNINANSGSNSFDLRSYNGNYYAQASAYKSKENPMEVWLITPSIALDNSTEEVLTFKTKTGYNNGAALSVFVSTDYDGSGNPSDFTWLEVDATLANGPSNGYESDFTNSGLISLDCLSGNVYVAFKYLGGDGGTTTTFQIDDVKVTGK